MKKRRIARLYVEVLESRLTPTSAATPTGQLWYSTNWSGYSLDTAPGQVQAVSAEWNVPAVTGSSTAYSSTWVGIDGDNSGTVEQIGTASEVHTTKVGRNTVVSYTYYAWWEMYPANAMQSISSMTVHAGDHIQASVTYVGDNPTTHYNLFTLSITDTTSGQSFSVTTGLNKVVQRSSAEWIQEAPSSFFGVLPLANFGSVTLTNVQATFTGTNDGTVAGNIWTLAPYAQVYSGASSSINAIDMVVSSHRTSTVIAAVSPLNSNGDFQVVFSSTSPSAPPLAITTQSGTNERIAVSTDTAPASIPHDVAPTFAMANMAASGSFSLTSAPPRVKAGNLPALFESLASVSAAHAAFASFAGIGPFQAVARPGASWASIYDTLDLQWANTSYSVGFRSIASSAVLDASHADETQALAEAHASLFAQSAHNFDLTGHSLSQAPGQYPNAAQYGLTGALSLAGLMLYGQNFVIDCEEENRRLALR